jgi:hypothetical protein
MPRVPLTIRFEQLTQAPLLTRPNLSKEAPWVGQRRPNRTPPLQALSDHVGPRKRQGKAARLVERCFHGPMEHPRPPVNSDGSTSSSWPSRSPGSKPEPAQGNFASFRACGLLGRALERPMDRVTPPRKVAWALGKAM